MSELKANKISPATLSDVDHTRIRRAASHD